MANVAVIGAGAMGLATAYFLLKAGHEVTVFEADGKPGGMAAHFDFDGLSIEQFYHFVCKADQPLFDLMDELGMGDAMVWRPTSMGYFFSGKLHPWGDPLSLLRFPHISLITKIRYGLHAFISTKRSDWSKLDRVPADKWIKGWIGEEGYTKLWHKLFHLKFFEHTDNISAAWIWTRIKRVGTSRRSIFQEEMGYIRGGSETLVQRLFDELKRMGGVMHLGTPARRVHLEDGRVSGVTSRLGFQRFDHVISTIPIPYIPEMIPDLPPALMGQYRAQQNIGVVCVLHKLDKPVTPHFWVNINDDRIEIPGIIEFSNLRDVGPDHVVYIPYYMPESHPKFSRPDRDFVDESLSYLKMINPDLTDADVKASKVGRLRYAQPMCPPGFLDGLPPVQTGVEGLQVADTSYYYPEDRGISEGIRLARLMAEAIPVEIDLGPTRREVGVPARTAEAAP
jgi:protoporphyrinogen oxidase